MSLAHRSVSLALPLLLLIASGIRAQSQDEVVQRRFLSPASTKTSKPGDKFALLVLSSENEDEEGRVIGRGSKGRDIATLLALSAVGAAIGAASGGRTGATQGAAAGTVVATAIVLGTKGPEIEFSPGSESTIVLRRRAQ